MLTRPVISRLFQQTVRRYHAEGHHQGATMDQLPIPRGSWQAQYDRNNKRYTSILMFGIAFAVGSVALAKGSGLLYLNYAPPKSID